MKKRVILAVIVGSLWLLALYGWFRSHTRGFDVTYYDRPRSFGLTTIDGLITTSWGELESENFSPPAGWQVTWRISGDLTGATGGTVLGFGSAHDRRVRPGYRADAYIVTVPWWSIVLPLFISGVVLCLSIVRLKRHDRRLAAGLCPSCGYDLRESPGRCPECGHGEITVDEVSAP